jgi:FixJ family two-component response regulator
MSDTHPLIAIIDDEEPVRKALGRLLQSVGMAVRTYSGGAEFLAALRSNRPDCAVLDLHMPEMTGFDVLERIAGMDVPVPVVTITGHDTTDAEQRVLCHGASAYLRKPINGDVLVAAISRAIAEAAKVPPSSPA